MPAPILLVEDDDSIREMMVMLLDLEGFTVVPVTDGADALAYLSGGDSQQGEDNPKSGTNEQVGGSEQSGGNQQGGAQQGGSQAPSEDDSEREPVEGQR